MSKTLLVLHFFFFFFLASTARAESIDSLKNLAETTSFPERIDHLIDWYSATTELFHEHEINMMQAGIDWFEKKEKLSDEEQLTWAALQLMQGSMYADNERLNDLFENASSVILMADSVGGDSKKWLHYKGQAYFQLSTVTYLEDRMEESMKHLEKAYEVFEKMDNQFMMARTLNSMGARQSDLGNHEEAMQLSARAADMYQREGSEYGYLRASFYQAVALIELEDLPEAESLLYKLIPQMRETEHVSLNAALTNLGDVQTRLGKMEAAENNLAEALILAKNRRVNYTVALTCQFLANLEEKRGNYAEALFYQREQARYADSIRLQAQEAQLKRAQAEFEQFENEQKIKELEAKVADEQQSKNWLIAGGALLFALAIGTFWFFYQKKKKELEAASRTVSLNIQAEAVTDDEPPLDPFLEDFLELVKKRLGEESLSVESIAQDMRMSRVQLFKKVKAASGASPSAIIREYRLEVGKKLLLENTLTVSEAAYRVGFSNPNSFSRAFKEKFGSSPSAFLAKNASN